MISQIIFLIIGLVIGYIIGWFFGCSIDRMVTNILWKIDQSEIDEQLWIK